MIKHIVLFKMKPDCSKETLEEIQKRLLALPSKIDVIREFEVGINMNKTNNSYDLAIVGIYDSLDDLKVYATHPDHVEVADFIHGFRENNISIDYEV